jgi:hypothetical protein
MARGFRREGRCTPSPTPTNGGPDSSSFIIAAGERERELAALLGGREREPLAG